jgi:hypothetical protein
VADPPTFAVVLDERAISTVMPAIAPRASRPRASPAAFAWLVVEHDPVEVRATDVAHVRSRRGLEKLGIGIGCTRLA